jgi:excinuclease ABC subunit A
MKEIRLWGVKQNNLKNIDVKIPLGSFAVVCGPSGSGKSSLAFETLYAEGQRRYIESLSNYTKQFLNKAPKPDLDSIENVPPAISIEQKNSVKSSRSSVGTITEVVDYLRLIFEKIGYAKCPDHGIELEKDSPSSGTKKILEHFEARRGYILSPVIPQDHLPKKKRPSNKARLALLIEHGVLRIYIPKLSKKKSKIKGAYSVVPMGEIIDVTPKTKLPEKFFYIVTDRLAFTKEDGGRITDSLSQAYSQSLKINSSLVAAQAAALTTEGELLLLNENLSCSICDYNFPDITSALFSFNSPVGACGTCNGFGNTLSIDPQKVIPNPELSIAQGAIRPFAMPSAARDRRVMMKFCSKNKIDVHAEWKNLPKKHQDLLWNGNDDFWGVVGLFDYLETKKYKMHVRVFLARHKSAVQCATCLGSRLKPHALHVHVGKKNIAELSAIPVDELLTFVSQLKLTDMEVEICAEPLKQLRDRLQFICDVGLGYLTTDRQTKTLSGGEFQRLKLSTQLGIGLSQTLYVLDEPTIGLHPKDNARLIKVLKQLNDLGNTLVVVEHDQDVIENANYIIEMGPGSGHLGGEVVYTGDYESFLNCKESATAPYLTPNRKWTPMRHPRTVNLNNSKYTLELSECSGHNLKNVDLKIPLNRIVAVTGVSGSGKSTLITDTLYPALAREFGVEYLPGLPYKKITGTSALRNVLLVDQSPIGSTSRSCPVTYLKVYDGIRSVMAQSNEARALGYTASTFSLNVDGGRCPVCRGLGIEIIDMMFMDDLEIPCDACDGKKFRPEVLEIKYKNKNIHEVLNLTISEAMDFFVQYPNIRRPLALLREVGLDYITLGQSAKSLSGGESQRLKIARELNITQTKETLYILDEPTTGLHFREVELLMKVLHRLVDAGGSVLIIEHNQDVIRNSDYVIELGPEAGFRGGEIVYSGIPRDSH